MSKIYEKLQPLNQDSGNGISVKPPESGGKGAAPKTGHTGLSLKRLCLLLLLVVAVMAILAAALPWYLSKLGGRATAVRPARKDERAAAQSAADKKDQADPLLRVNMVESYRGTDADGERIVTWPVESSATKGTGTPNSGGGFITSVEVVTTASESSQGAATVTRDPITVVTTTSTRSPAKQGLEMRLDAEGESPGVVQRHSVTKHAPQTQSDTASPKWTAPDPDFTSDFERAVQLQRSGQYESALDYYEKYLIAHEGHAGSHNNMGIIYQHQREYELAITNYNIALAAEPTSFRVHNNVAMCHILKGDYAKAAYALSQSLKHKEDNYEALVNMGVTQTALRNYDKAEDFLQRAAELYPDQARGVYNIGYLYQCRAEYGKAADYYRVFLEKSGGRYPDQEKEVRRFLRRLRESG